MNKHQTIQLLPEHIIDQIKAGEVIERPATLLKELLENSIDAGADKVKVEINNNGLDLIRVTDNGSGISFDNLPLAFCRHATSKIAQFEDIYNLFTYGFRGEALASMASVSKINCTSTYANESGTIKIEGGEVISHERSSYTGDQSGTSVYVKDLFYNTPVRLKFIQSKTSEKNQLKKILSSFVLTKRDVEFQTRFDEGSLKRYPVDESFFERINKLLFTKSPQEFHYNSREFEDSEVEIILSKSFSKGNAGKQQFIFVNDRYIQDTAIHKIILNSATHLWDFGFSGHYFIFIKTKPHLVDVNVHPNKLHVKFYTPGKVHSLISQSIKEIKLERPRTEIPTLAPTSVDSGRPESSTFEYQGTSFDHLVDFSPEQTNTFNIHLLSKRFAIIQINEKPHLLDTLAFALHEISKSEYDPQITPLMVATPMRGLGIINEIDIEIFSKLGFHLEKLGSDSLLLQAYPSALEAYNCAAIAALLIQYCNLNLTMNFANLSASLSRIKVEQDLVSNIYELNNKIQNLSGPMESHSKFLISFDDSSISKLFYD